MGTWLFIVVVVAVIAVAAGPILLFRKLKHRTRSRVLAHPFAVELFVFLGLLMLHRGTGTGIIIASVATTLISIMLSALRKADGYYKLVTLRLPGGKTKIVRVFEPGWFHKEIDE